MCASRQTVMGANIYDEQLSYKLIPKLNGLSMIKTASDSDLKVASGHTNGYIHHNEAKNSQSGSQIVFINAAMYVEKLDLPAPLVKGYSQGDGNYRQKESSSSNSILTDNRDIISTGKALTRHPNKQINGVIGNGTGDRLLSRDTICPKVSEPSEVACHKTKFDVENHVDPLSIRSSVNRHSETSSLESFCSISAEESSSSASSSNDGCKSDNIAVTQCPEKSSPDIQKSFVPAEVVKDTRKPLPRLLYRTYSDINRGTALSPVIKHLDENPSTRCELEATKRYSTRLADAGFLGTFPEKSIRRKILNAFSEKGDLYYMDIEDNGILPQNWENLIRNEDIAWHRWYVSKLEQSKQRKEAKKNEESRRMAEEERQKKHRLRKQEVEDRNICIWRERKDKEDEAKRRELSKKLELERQKKETEQVRTQIMAQRARVEWSKRKDIERKEQKLREERLQQEKEEEKRLQALRSKTALEMWNEKAKTRPRPMSVAIIDHKGRSDPSLARLNWNPVPWQNLIEEPKAHVLKDPGRKKFVKPFNT